jgi:hypothetical protein
LNASSSLALKIRTLAGKSKLGDDGAVRSLGNPARLFAGHGQSPKMKKLRIASQFFALASLVLWGTTALSETIVPMISEGGTFRVPVTINDELTLKFVIDSGAADVSVPADVVMTCPHRNHHRHRFPWQANLQVGRRLYRSFTAVRNSVVEGRGQNFRERCR